HRERGRGTRRGREGADGRGPAGGVGAERGMAGARGSARRELVARLLAPRRNRHRGTGPGLRALKRALPVALSGALTIPLAIVALEDGKGEYYVSPHGHLFASVGANDARDFPYLTGLARADLKDGERFGPRALHRALALVRQSGGLGVSEVHVDRVRGLTLLPMRPSVPIELGWSGFGAKLARLPRVLALWAGREPEIVAVNLQFDDEVIVRTHPAR